MSLSSADNIRTRAGEQPGTIVIVSGFRPFQGGMTNPSLAVAARYAAGVRRRPGYAAVEVTLDVVWDADQRTVRRVIEDVRNQWPPGAVEWTAFGQGTELAMETVARNLRETAEDNRGLAPGFGPGHPGTVNDPDGPEQYVSDAVDVRRILDGMAKSGIIVRESVEAGGYLCESVLYELLQQVRRGQLRCGRFFHVPATEGIQDGDPERVRMERERERFADLLSEITTRGEERAFLVKTPHSPACAHRG